MEWRRRGAGDYATGPHSWGNALIWKNRHGWSLNMFAYGLSKGWRYSTLREAKTEAPNKLNLLYEQSQSENSK